MSVPGAGAVIPMLYYAVGTLYVVICLVLLLVVLLQQGKGGDIAAAFGGSGSQTAFGARAGATLLSRVTAVCAALFMIGALVLAILGQRGPGSVVGGGPPPPPATVPAAAQPAEQRQQQQPPAETPKPAEQPAPNDQ